ncbi:MAG: formylglycine-generating enzyme family protein [Bacteroidetes bacterium]|nr:formylglycine-generating enzyme family protein [Bacteroidota bacterium]
MRTIYAIASLGIIYGLFSLQNPTKKKPKLAKFFAENYAYIPSGNVLLDGETVHVDSFYLFKTECSNFNYLEFLTDLKKLGSQKEYNLHYPDTNNWNSFSFSPYAKHYFTHPAYRDFPVVNVNKESAEAYCVWLGQKLSQGQPDFIFEARLPTRVEWVRAAKKDSQFSYSWNTNQLQNEKGQMKANCIHVKPENLSKNIETGNIEIKKTISPSVSIGDVDIMAPVKAYWPGNFSLYNMNGNAAEMTQDGYVCGGSWRQFGYDIRNDSYEKYSKSNINIGFRPLLRVRRKE